MRISDWSSDVCSSDLHQIELGTEAANRDQRTFTVRTVDRHAGDALQRLGEVGVGELADILGGDRVDDALRVALDVGRRGKAGRSEERRVGKECVRTCKSRWAPYH